MAEKNFNNKEEQAAKVAEQAAADAQKIADDAAAEAEAKVAEEKAAAEDKAVADEVAAKVAEEKAAKEAAETAAKLVEELAAEAANTVSVAPSELPLAEVTIVSKYDLRDPYGHNTTGEDDWVRAGVKKTVKLTGWVQSQIDAEFFKVV